MAASFLDKIRIYHILHDELRQYKTLEIKNCQRMRFNTGGNFFFVVDQKNVLINNSGKLSLAYKSCDFIIPSTSQQQQ